MQKLVATLAVAVLAVGYLFYGVIQIEPGLEKPDDVIWTYARKKYTRAISLTAEFLGMGHPVNVTRGVDAFLSPREERPWPRHGVEMEQTQFAGVPVFIYRPENQVRHSPAFVWIHGGGWVFGLSEADHDICVDFARRLDIIVVSIDYRLAPEHPYPAPLDDCYKALTHFINVASDYNVDATRIAVGGISAGGNLAAAVTLLARDENWMIRPSLQVLVVPALQPIDFNTPSYQENANNAGLPRYWMINCWLWYTKGSKAHSITPKCETNHHTSSHVKRGPLTEFINHDLVARRYRDESSYSPSNTNFGDALTWVKLEKRFTDHYVAPLLAPYMDKMSKTYIITAQYDVVRDDGIMFARRLEKAGSPVKHVHYEYVMHPFLFMRDKLDTGKKAFEDLITYMKMHL